MTVPNCPRARSAENGAEPGASVGQTLLGASCLALQPLTLNALSLPAMAYIIRRLGPEGYAHWMIAASLLGVGGALTNLGLRGEFVRRVAADPSSARQALAEQLGVRIVLSMVASAVVVAGAGLLGYSTATVLCILVGCIGVLLTSVATTFADLLQAREDTARLATVNLVSGLALTGCSVIAAWSSGGPVLVAGAYLVGPAVSSAMLGARVCRSGCPIGILWDWAGFGRRVVGARHFAVQGLVAAGCAQAELVLLPRLIGMSHFGVFSAGATLAGRLGAVPDGLCTAAYPAMVRGFRRAPSLGRGPVFLYGALAVWSAVVFACAGSWWAGAIGSVLFPRDPGPFAGIVRVTIWSVPLVAIEMVMGYALNAAGRESELARASIRAGITGLASAAVLVTRFGVEGACWYMLARPAIRVAFLAPLLVPVLRNAGGAREPRAAAPLSLAARKAA